MASQHPGVASETRTSGLIGWLPYLTLLAALIIGCRNGLKWLIGIRSGFDPYVYWILKANFFNSGFARRSLGSTVFSILDHGAAQTSMSIFSLICGAFLLIPLAVFVFKLARGGGWAPYWLAFILLVSPQMFWFWGLDTGRSDMLNNGFVAWALLATLDRRYGLAAITLLVGSLNHETVLILGVPLCATFWFLDCREGGATVVQGFKALTVLATGFVAIVVLQHFFSANPQQIAQTMAAGPTPDHSAWLREVPPDSRLVASYMTTGGFRTLVASHCMMYSSPGAYILPLSCFVTLLLYVIIYPSTSKIGIGVFGVACLLPMTFLSIIAIDYGRWLAFAVTDGWLATAALRIRGWEPASHPRWRYALGGLALFTLVGLGHAGLFYSGRRIHDIADKIYGSSMDNPAHYLPRCDPQWETVALGLINK